MPQSERESSELDIYTMPLTQVSIEHGTEGLERRLQHALGRIGLENSEMIQASIRLGLELHQDDRRTYEPYNNHLLRVTLRLIEDFGVTDEITLAAAPLHDSIEDHSKELAKQYLGIEGQEEDQRVVRHLGHQGLVAFALQYDAAELADIVLAVSNPLLQAGEDKIRSYVTHVEALMQGDQQKARILKIADLFDNFDVPKGLEDPSKRGNLDRKQIDIYGAVEAGIKQPGTDIEENRRTSTLALVALRRSEAMRRLGDRSTLKPAS